jgi:ribosomal protein L11 methyltransferase
MNPFNAFSYGTLLMMLSNVSHAFTITKYHLSSSRSQLLLSSASGSSNTGSNSISKEYLQTIEDNRNDYRFHPFQVGEFIIKATYDDISLVVDSTESSNIIQLVDIGSGWGDGMHPTTRMCLEFINQVVVPNKTILVDYGCGSGILSILAAKKGASQCIAIDIDEVCLRATTNNVATNKVDDVVSVLHTARVVPGDLLYPMADVTVANILAGPLTRLVAALWLSTKPGGM